MLVAANLLSEGFVPLFSQMVQPFQNGLDLGKPECWLSRVHQVAPQ